jgi:hypothetical protein
MKRTSIRADTLIALLALATIALLTPVQVMPQVGSGPSRAMRGPLYNPATETTAKGMVKEVQQLSGKGVRGPSGTMWSACPRGWAGNILP